MIKKPGTHGKEYDKAKQRFTQPINATESKPMIGYCVKCRAKRGINGGKIETRNSRRMHLGGKCEKCGTGMAKILPSKKAKE